jgi:hypothetical protein
VNFSRSAQAKIQSCSRNGPVSSVIEVPLADNIGV